jgi:hypothetical protein
MRPNANHLGIILGKVLSVLFACAAVALAVYVIRQNGEAGGTVPKPIPVEEPRKIRLFATPRPEEPADPKFFKRPGVGQSAE